MFYFDKIDGKLILKSDFIKNADAFFTTREICICDKRDKLDNLSPEFAHNKKLLSDYLKIDPQNLICPVQTHSANIELVQQNKFNYPDTDALILNNPNQAIYLNFADCTPIILYDEKQNIGAISHAGWRGTAQKIAPKTVQKMTEIFNTNSKDVIALIGPAICEKCYEVGADVYKKLMDSIQKTSVSVSNEKYHVNLKKINKTQLLQIGVEKIDTCPYCTCCDNKYFFSYRKENATTLRHSAVLKLK